MASQVPPKKNTAFNLGLCLYKSDGTFIANPGTITAKISKDFGDYADVGTVSEEDSTYGQIKLALTNTEMNADVVMLYVVDNTSGCVPFTQTIYTATALLDDIKTDTAAILADTGTDGVVLAADAITAAKIADDAFSSEHFNTGCITADAIADNAIDAGAIAADAITAAKIANGAIDLATFAADVGTTALASNPVAKAAAKGAWDSARADHETANTFGDIDTTADIAAAVRDVSNASPAAGSLGETVNDILTDTGTTLPATLALAAQLPALGLTTGVIVDHASNSATTFSTNLAGADNFWNNALILITSGALAGQVKEIGDFADADGFVTLTSGQAFTAEPAADVTFTIINR